ncbi:hypothetical protein NE237_009872 [Protea cynaroides]|uniref:Uncharacterized protein n=1 Tax=Protea cynaroides TaxID=273540 RepID=A0A9Q0R123_9MAGN|nr:hypothetical protein NE237_009872 [Protea cynaroides]
MRRESSSLAPPDQYRITVSMPQMRSSLAQKMNYTEEGLPISDPRSIASKKESSHYRSSHSKKWIHVILLILFICWIILWWFSHPVNVVIEDGSIVAVHRLMALSMFDTQDNLPTMLSPAPSMAMVPQEMNNGSEAPTICLAEGRLISNPA